MSEACQQICEGDRLQDSGSHCQVSRLAYALWTSVILYLYASTEALENVSVGWVKYTTPE